MPDNQFNPGPYGSASTSYSSASGPNPQSAPSAATTWASPGQNAGILPPTNQKSLIGKPGLGLSVFWLVLGLITLAVGAGLASLNLTDATLPSLSSFSPGTSKSAQLEANRTYAFYAASTKLDSARKTSCVVSGPDGYSPTVTNANSSEELQLNRSYYKVATFSPNKSGSYSFACSNPNLDRADVFAIADITDTTTVTSSNDLIYARIFVGAGAFLGLVGLGLGIFGVIALIRKLKARRNFTDGLPAQGGDSASASSGAFNGYVPTTPGQAPLGYQAPGVASQGPDAAAASQWAAAGAGAAGTAAAAAPQWGAPQGQWAAQAQSSQTQSSPAAQSQASAQSSNSSAQAASAHSAPQAPNPYVTAQPQTNPYVTPQAQQAPASQPAQPQSYAQSAQPAQPAQPQANPYITAQAQPGQNVQPGQPIEVYGQQATQPLNPYLTQPQAQAQAQAQAPQVPQGYGQAQASVAQSAAQAGTPAGTQVGTPAGAHAGSPAGAQGQNAAGYWPVPNFTPSDQAAQPGQPGQAGQPTQASQGYGQVPQGYGQPVQPPANPYVTAQAQQAPASQTAQPQSYTQSAQPAQAPQVPQGYGQAQPGQNVQPGQPIEVYGQQATQPLNPYLTQPQAQPSVAPSAAQAPQGYGRPAQPGQGYGQVPQGYGQVPQGYGQAQPVQPAQSVQQPAQVPGVSQLEHPNQPGRPTQPLQPTNDTRVIASPTDTTQVVFEPANPVYKSPASQSAASQQAGANEEVEETDQRPVDAMYTDPTRVISTTEAANRYN
jgi:putative cuticle protein